MIQNIVEVVLAKLIDEFGKMFTRDELLQEYEKSQKDLPNTMKALGVKKGLDLNSYANNNFTLSSQRRN